MKRWTNDQWLSTLHRVVNPPANANAQMSGGEPGEWAEHKSTRRQSVAFFYNVDRDVQVTNLTSAESKYAPIVAGDFLMEKHLAATVGETSKK